MSCSTSGNNPFNCCLVGFHGAGEVPSHGHHGPPNGNGNQPVQTFAWASYFSPGLFRRPDGGTRWALQDIYSLSHEIAEWADDPFVNNYRGALVVRRRLPSTAARTSSRPATQWLPSGSPWERTSTFRGRTRMARRAPTATIIRRTRYSSRGSCASRRITSPSPRRARQRTSAAIH